MFNKPFDPFDWYWLADDKCVYSSVRQRVVDESDESYQSWVNTGNLPTSWPRDDAGNQSDEALQEVLTPYGLSIVETRRQAETRRPRK
jgi:hypothetical protein